MPNTVNLADTPGTFHRTRVARRLRAAALLSFGLLAAAGCSASGSPPTVEDVTAVLDDWHAAAAAADEARYFGHFASDAVFLGTDDGERWTVDEFRDYALQPFSEGRGWTYRPRERHVLFSDDGSLAWFDEKLDNERYGRVRGTGVLRRTDQGWKIVHYSLSFPIPNEVTLEVVDIVRGFEAR